MSVVIVAIVVMAIAVPVIAGSGTTTKTAENGYTYRATELDTSTGTHTLTFTRSSSEADATVTVNGIEIGTLKTAALIGRENVISWNADIGAIRCTNLADGTTSNGAQSSTLESVITITDGQWIGVYGNSISIPSIIIPSDDGDLGAMSTGNVSPGATCYWANFKNYNLSMVASGDPWQVESIQTHAYHLSGSAKIWSGAPSSVQTSNVGETSMTVGNIIFDEEILSYFTTADLMYFPIEYTETTSGVTGTVKTMIDMIPLLMIVGLMVATVAAYIKFRGE